MTMQYWRGRMSQLVSEYDIEHPYCRVDTSFQCPSNESLAAFVDGVLDNLSMMYVDEHLNYCPRCYELVSETRAVLQMVQRDKQEAQDEVREEYRCLCAYCTAGITDL